MRQESPRNSLCVLISHFLLRRVTVFLFSPPPGSTIDNLERDSAQLLRPPFHMPHTKVCYFVIRVSRPCCLEIAQLSGLA